MAALASRAAGDPAGMLGDLLQDRLAVNLLAARDEPEFESGERLHDTLPWLTISSTGRVL